MRVLLVMKQQINWLNWDLDVNSQDLISTGVAKRAVRD
jgi:hypothetical protein